MKIDPKGYDIEVLNLDGSGRWDGLDDVLYIEYETSTVCIDGCVREIVSETITIICIIDGRVMTLSLEPERVNFIKRC